MEQQITDKLNFWMSDAFDEQTRKEVKQLAAAGNESEIIDSFYRNLEFGTGGLRGLMGPGTNRMNKYTVGMATQGIANYLLKVYPGEEIKVAVAHDCRNNSELFTKVTADVFSANGFKVYVFPGLRPTPYLSYIVREMGCKSGVVITASHNPKEYNGYKAYWADGAQMIAPHDKNSIAEVLKIEGPAQVKFTRKPENIITLGEEYEEKYMNRVYDLCLAKEEIARQKDMKIVFTPIHGTGITLVPALLKKFGFQNVKVVQEQSTVDGDFPTVVYPNPEEAEALSIALKQCKEWDADLLMGTDPDSDRVGIACKNHKGEYVLLNGNQTGSLLFYYQLNAWKRAGKITGKEFIVKTIVTTDLMHKMCADYGVECVDVLTGFKYIAGLIEENKGKKTFICGGEESYGYLVGDFVRDKDAISACAYIAEMTAFAKDKGMSLFDWLIDMYINYGYYKEDLISLTKKGKTGQEEIAEMMSNLRANPPKTLVGSPVITLLDYELQVATDLSTGVKTPINLPKSNVLQFLTADGTKVSARPSGTEPKIKFYFGVNAPLKSKEEFDKVGVDLDNKIKSIINEMNLR